MRHLFRWAVPDLTKYITVIIPDMYIKWETGSLIAQPNLFAFEYAGHQGERWPANTGISRRCKCQPTNVAIRQAQMSTLFPHLVQVVLSPGWSDRQGGRSDTNLWVCLKRLKTGNLVSFDRGAVVVVEISGLLYQLLLILMEWILMVRLNTDNFLPHS